MMFEKLRVYAAVAVFAVAGVVGDVYAGTVEPWNWNNGAPDLQNPYGAQINGNGAAADDFGVSLTSSSYLHLTQLKFISIESEIFRDGVPIDGTSGWDGNLQVEIFADAGGSVGPSVASANLTTEVTRLMLGPHSELFNFWFWDVDLSGLNFDLANGVYWVGVHAGLSTAPIVDPTAEGLIYWTGSLLQLQSTGVSYDYATDTATSLPWDFSWEMNGIGLPIGDTLWLILLGGMASLVAAARRGRT